MKQRPGLDAILPEMWQNSVDRHCHWSGAVFDIFRGGGEKAEGGQGGGGGE